MALEQPAPVMNPFTPAPVAPAPMGGGGLPAGLMQLLAHLGSRGAQFNQALPPQPIAPAQPQNPIAHIIQMMSALQHPGAQPGMGQPMTPPMTGMAPPQPTPQVMPTSPMPAPQTPQAPAAPQNGWGGGWGGGLSGMSSAAGPNLVRRY